MLAITYKKIMKIKVAEWGTPKKYVHDDESPIELEGLVGQTNRLIPGVVPESARITVGNLYTRKRGKVVSGSGRLEKAPLDLYIVVKL